MAINKKTTACPRSKTPPCIKECTCKCCPCHCHEPGGKNAPGRPPSGPSNGGPSRGGPTRGGPRRGGPPRPPNHCPCLSICFGVIALLILASFGCVIFNGLESCLSKIGWCSASGTNLENFACPLKPMGATILEIDCKTKTCSPKCCSRSLLFFKKCGYYFYPENILSKNVDQWCFEGNHGAVTIKLGRHGHLTEFKMSSGSSILDTCAGNMNNEDSVRDFEIIAYGAGKNMKFTQTYRGKKTSEIQKFYISSANSVHAIEYVKLVVLNNYGASETKINRVFVMGFGKIPTTTKSR